MSKLTFGGRLTGDQIATRINEHLRRFETDPVINAKEERGGLTLSPYYNAFASYEPSTGVFYVQYIGYQGPEKLSRSEAIQYLEWLDAGNVGRHRQALKETR